MSRVEVQDSEEKVKANEPTTVDVRESVSLLHYKVNLPHCSVEKKNHLAELYKPTFYQPLLIRLIGELTTP